MQNRHYLELALEDAINARNINNMERLVKCVIDDNSASLMSRDASGRTFLHQVIQNKFTAGIDLLLHYYAQEHNNFANYKDTNKVTVFHYALRYGSKELVEGLYPYVNDNCLNIKDKNGLNAIFYAVANADPAVLNYLLLELSGNCDLVEAVNYYSYKGLMPLAVAKRFGLIDNMATLINYGADIKDVLVSKNLSFIESIKHNEQLVLELFNKLNENESRERAQAKRKTEFLQAWRQLLLKNQEDEVIKSIYFVLAGKHSLLAAAHAQLEFNPDVTVNVGEQNIPSGMLYDEGLMPAPYRERVLERESLLGIKRGACHASLSARKSQQEDKTKYNYELIKKDLLALDSLCGQVDEQITYIQNKDKELSNHGKKMLRGFMAGLVLIPFCLVFMGVVLSTPFGISTVAMVAVATGLTSTASVVGMLSAVFFAPAVLGFILGGVSLYKFGILDVAVNKSIVSLAGNIKDKMLNSLQLQEKTCSASDLTVPVKRIRALENNVAQLEDSSIVDLSSVITTLHDLKSSLTGIKRNLIKSNKPITRLTRAVKENNSDKSHTAENVVDQQRPVKPSEHGLFSRRQDEGQDLYHHNDDTLRLDADSPAAGIGQI